MRGIIGDRQRMRVQPKGELAPIEEWSRGIATSCHDHNPDEDRLKAHADRLRGRLFPFRRPDGRLIGYRAPYKVGEVCWVKEKWADLKAARERAKRLVEQWPYGPSVMPDNIDDGPDAIYKADWDAQGKKFVGKWIDTTEATARRFVRITSIKPVQDKGVWWWEWEKEEVERP